MITKHLNNIINESERVIWQALATELDVTLMDMLYIAESDLEDSIEIEHFNRFYSTIQALPITLSVNDSVELYIIEPNRIVVILCNTLDSRLIVFMRSDAVRIKNAISKS